MLLLLSLELLDSDAGAELDPGTAVLPDDLFVDLDLFSFLMNYRSKIIGCHFKVGLIFPFSKPTRIDSMVLLGA